MERLRKKPLVLCSTRKYACKHNVITPLQMRQRRVHMLCVMEPPSTSSFCIKAMMHVPGWFPWREHRFPTQGDHYVVVINLDHEHRQNQHLMKTNKTFRCRKCLCILVAKQVFVDTMLLTACKYNDFNLPHSKSRYQRLLIWDT